MKRIISILVCLLLLCSCTSALAATVTATGNVYLRSGPGLDYSTVTALEKGDVASFLGATSIDDRGVTWYKAFYNNVTGWLSSKYSELDTWSWSYGFVTATGNVWVRSGPGLGYAEIGCLDKDDTLEYRNESSVDGRGVTWYKVYYGTHNSAWISSRYSTLTTYGSWATELITATAKVYVRSGPGTSYDILTGMWKDDTALYLGASSKDYRGVLWYKVNYGGVIGWVSSTYAELDSGKSESKSSGTITATGDAWVRSGPGLDYEVVTGMSNGDTASYLGDSSYDSRGVLWYKVKFEGQVGWISSRYSQLGSGKSSGGSSSSLGTIKATGDAWVRSGPSLDDDVVTGMSNGDTATYLGDSSYDARGVLWYKIKFDGVTGWISSKYSKLVW